MSNVGLENEKLEGTSKYASYTAENVLDAVRWKDWSSLRSLSLRPGGFGEDRKHAWPFLLHVEKETRSVNLQDDADSKSSPMRRRRQRRSSESSLKEKLILNKANEEILRDTSVDGHPDERQIKLDTDRSFVLYGVDDKSNIELAQTRLNSLITTVFRRHPLLSYFQGYHDIITVLFLTLNESDQLISAEKMSLHRLRDAMGKGLEPLLGLLHILKYLFRLVDPEYAALLERNTPLPYFALSNLLTLFSHDVPTLSLIQHVFDFLLCRPPIAVVYLAAAVTLVHRDEALRMEREGEEGSLHSLLSSIPRLSDGEETDESDEQICNGNILDESLLKPVSAESGNCEAVQDTRSNAEAGNSCPEKPETREIESSVEQTIKDDSVDQDGAQTASSGITPETPRNMEGSESTTRTEADLEPSIQIDGSQSASMPGSSVVSDLSSSDLGSSESPGTATSPSRPASPHSIASTDHAHAPAKTISLPELLQRADSLLEQYPPSHPSLHVSAIMGPRSVIFTWSEDPDSLMSDTDAEAITAHPELVVLPFVDPDEAAAKKEAEEAASSVGRIRRKLRKRMRKEPFKVRLDKKTVLTGTVVALSVAVAVYSVRAKGSGGVLDASRSDKALRKSARIISDILIGGSERLLETFGW